MACFRPFLSLPMFTIATDFGYCGLLKNFAKSNEMRFLLEVVI